MLELNLAVSFWAAGQSFLRRRGNRVVSARKHERSDELWQRGMKAIPVGTQTFGKSPKQWGFGTVPNYVRRAQGSHIWDVDGNEYVDYGMALGPIILGYNYPSVNAAIARQLADGSIFSLNHPLEVELSELLIDVIPCAEMVRFGKNGSDATAAAVRLARGWTERDVVLCSGYHGWQDWYIGSTSRHRGVPKAVRDLTHQFPYNDRDALRTLLREHDGNVAAVIMEASNFEPPLPGYLEDVKGLAHDAGALLIFDEVLTGFRMALGGAQSYFGVLPDLAVFAKAMANGMPVSALVGRADVMDLFNEVFYSFTFAGETLSLAAAVATIHELQKPEVLHTVWARGGELKRGCLELIAEFGLDGVVACSGYDCWPRLSFAGNDDHESRVLETLFRQEVTKRGILMRTGMFLSYSHSADDLRQTLDAYGSALELIAHARRGGKLEERLDGPVIQPVIRDQIRVSG
ncbi:MAG: aminotransferase class III-fold pyridoxal phosphate-dependent enzyme [Chloroflexi bacterium]|nr:aminotransferase class III-fold pyridoxal phosphate-dependent enzyme [Chloroflexota bacterium]